MSALELQEDILTIRCDIY